MKRTKHLRERTESHEMSLKPWGLQSKIQFALSWYRHPNVSGSISICNVEECDHSYHSRVFLCDSFPVQMLFYSCGNLDFKGKGSTPQKMRIKAQVSLGHYLMIFALQKKIIYYVLVLWPCHLSKKKLFLNTITKMKGRRKGPHNWCT